MVFQASLAHFVDYSPEMVSKIQEISETLASSRDLDTKALKPPLRPTFDPVIAPGEMKEIVQRGMAHVAEIMLQ
jgi:hypothetical protein